MILIISADNDGITNDICTLLLLQKKGFVRINDSQCITDVFFDFAQNNFSFTINNEACYNLDQFTSVYYRNGTIKFKELQAHIDLRIKNFFNSELNSITNFIYYYLNKNCSNIYGNLVTRSVNKLEVLDLAQTLGFKIPETYIFSDFNNIASIINNFSFITKSISEMAPIFHENELYLNYTREVTLDELKTKKQELIPSLLQNKINVEYEIRIFFFEQKLWSIAMFDLGNNVDVRNVQNKKYVPYNLPGIICEKILNLSSHLKLKCGTIDLLKSGNDFYFLEINPLGQFQDLNYWGNYKIDHYIADLL